MLFYRLFFSIDKAALEHLCDMAASAHPRSGLKGCNRLAQLWADRSGVIVVKFALAMPVMLLIIGGMLDHSRYLREKSILQEAADAAALASAKELSLTDTKYENLAAVAQAVVAKSVSTRTARSSLGAPTVTTSVSKDPIEVDVRVTRNFDAMFSALTGQGLNTVEAKAIARVVGKPNICVLALSPDEVGAISLEKNARVTGQNCAVYSNSAHNNGLKSKNSASLTATLICTRGGKDGGPGNFNPDPIVDCPSFDDPLADRPEPFAAACDPQKPTIITTTTTLDPGTYCGLEIRGGAQVTLRDGIFAFKDKPLVVKDGGKLFGEAAGLYFTGASASFTFDAKSTISLKAPTSGGKAGLLIFAGRKQPPSLSYRILSDDARVLIGTIYIPSGELRIDATSPIADQSAYTAIVAEKMRLYGGPHLILNTNYSDTSVPVPDGVKGVGQPVALAR